MAKQLKIWSSMGLAILGTAVAANAGIISPLQKSLLSSFILVDADGEGGGTSAGEDPVYALGSTDGNAYKYKADEQIDAYIDLASKRYQAAAAAAKDMAKVIDGYLQKPDAETVQSARKAMAEARAVYLKTEAFRFYGGPVDKLASHINADPAKAGSRATSGWAALESLLSTEALPASELQRVTSQLVGDLDSLAQEWTSGTYPEKLRKLPEREVVGRMMNGMAVLAGYEMPQERALEDFPAGLEAIKQVWTGGTSNKGVNALVRTQDPATADEVDRFIAEFESKAGTKEEATKNMQALAQALIQAGNKLGVLVLIPSE